MEKESPEGRNWEKSHKIEKERRLHFSTLNFIVYINFRLNTYINQKIIQWAELQTQYNSPTLIPKFWHEL